MSEGELTFPFYTTSMEDLASRIFERVAIAVRASALNESDQDLLLANLKRDIDATLTEYTKGLV